MMELSTALMMFNREYRYLPPTTDNAKLVIILSGVNRRQLKFYILDTRKHPDGIVLDGWGRPLAFQLIADGLRISSAGKDGIHGNTDDLQTTVPKRPPAKKKPTASMTR